MHLIDQHKLRENLLWAHRQHQFTQAVQHWTYRHSQVRCLAPDTERQAVEHYHSWLYSTETRSTYTEALQHYPIKEFKDAAARRDCLCRFRCSAYAATEANRAAHG